MRLALFCKALMILLWLGAVGWLIRREAFPHWFQTESAGYRTVLRELPAVRDSWMKVLAEGKHVGYANSTIELEEADGREQLLLLSQFMLMVAMPQGPEQLRVTTQARLSGAQQLLRFEAALFFQQWQGNITGVRAQGDQFDVTLQFGPLAFTRRVSIPDQAVLNNPLGDVSLPPLREGQELRLRTMDPLSLSTEPREVVFRGEGHELIRIGRQEPQEARLITMTSGDMLLRIWADEFGQVLRQETPFGLVLESSTVQDAIRVPGGNALNPLTLQQQPFFLNLPGL